MQASSAALRPQWRPTPKCSRWLVFRYFVCCRSRPPSVSGLPVQRYRCRRASPRSTRRSPPRPRLGARPSCRTHLVTLPLTHCRAAGSLRSLGVARRPPPTRSRRNHTPPRPGPPAARSPASSVSGQSATAWQRCGARRSAVQHRRQARRQRRQHPAATPQRWQWPTRQAAGRCLRCEDSSRGHNLRQAATLLSSTCHSSRSTQPACGSSSPSSSTRQARHSSAGRRPPAARARAARGSSQQQLTMLLRRRTRSRKHRSAATAPQLPKAAAAH